MINGKVIELRKSKFMVDRFYSDTILKTISLHLMSGASEILKNFQMMVMLSPTDHGERNFVTFFQSDKGKDYLLCISDHILRNMDSINEEILKQYGISDSESSTLYHDEMCVTFRKHHSYIQQLIRSGNIYKISQIAKECF
jgi:hypothetical protein